MIGQVSVITPTSSGVTVEGIPMRIKETRYFSPPESGEFYERESTGLTISGVSLKPKGDKGDAIAVLQTTRNSNNHVLLVVDSSVAHIASSIAEGLPRSYTTHFNEHNPSPHPTLDQHYQTATAALSDTLLSQEATKKAHVAFAHILPTTGNYVYATVALTEGMIAILTNTNSEEPTGEPRMNIIYPSMLTPSEDMPGFSTGMVSVPRGSKVILSTGMEEYKEKGAIEAIATIYHASQQILSAAAKNTLEAYSQLILSLSMKEHILNAMSALEYTPNYQRYIANRNDMALAALIAQHDLTTLIKEPRHGNFILPQRAAFIASVVPKIKRKKANDS